MFRQIIIDDSGGVEDVGASVNWGRFCQAFQFLSRVNNSSVLTIPALSHLLVISLTTRLLHTSVPPQALLSYDSDTPQYMHKFGVFPSSPTTLFAPQVVTPSVSSTQPFFPPQVKKHRCPSSQAPTTHTLDSSTTTVIRRYHMT